MSLALADQQPKIWAENWQSKFEESSWYFLQGNLSTTGVMKYINNGKAAFTLVSRDNGRSDRYCGSIFPFSTTPCDNLVVDGNRYLIFKEKKYCCKCCNIKNGCGVIKRNWIENATFIGTGELGSSKVNNYLIKGLQNNYYSETIDGQKPKKLYQEPISDMIFDPDSYTENTVTEADFKLPDNFGDCDRSCPLLSLCSLVSLG